MRTAARLALALITAAAAAASLHAQQQLAAQVVSGPLEIRPGASRPGFDLRRLNTENYGSFVPFYVTDTEPLAEALKAEKVAADTPVLVTETASGRLALLTDQMAYHHLAQGRAGGRDWIATF